MRIDSNIKKRAGKAFKKAGFNFSTGMRIYANSVANTGRLPLDMITANGYTVGEEQEILKEMDHALKFGKRYTSVKEMHKDITREHD